MVATADDAALVIALALRLARASRRQRHDLAVGIHGDRRQRFARRRMSLPLPRLTRRPRRRAPFGRLLRLTRRRRRARGGTCFGRLARRAPLAARLAAPTIAAAPPAGGRAAGPGGPPPPPKRRPRRGGGWGGR